MCSPTQTGDQVAHREISPQAASGRPQPTRKLPAQKKRLMPIHIRSDPLTASQNAIWEANGKHALPLSGQGKRRQVDAIRREITVSKALDGMHPAGVRDYLRAGGTTLACRLSSPST